MARTKISGVLLAFCFSIPAGAQTADKPLTLDDSVAIALRQSPSARAAQIARSVAQVQADRDKPVARPTLTVSAAGTLQGPRVTFPRPDGREATFLPEQYGRLDAVLEQLLYRAGAGAARQRYAAQSDAATLDLRRSENDLAQTVKKAYLDVLRAESGVRTANDGLDAAQRYQTLVQAQISAGLAKPVDAETVKAQVAEAEAGQIQAENGRDLARQNFNRVLGRPLTNPVTLADVPPPAVPDNPDAAIATALQNRPELLLLDANLRAAQAGASLAKTQTQPGLYGRAQITEQTPSALYHEHYAAATLEIRWPILDGGKARLDAQEASLQVKRLEALREETQAGIRLEVTTAFQSMKNAQAQIRLAQTRQAGMEATATVAETSYQIGRGTVIETQAAQREVRTARERETQAVYDLQAASVDFAHAQGTLIAIEKTEAGKGKSTTAPTPPPTHKP